MTVDFIKPFRRIRSELESLSYFCPTSGNQLDNEEVKKDTSEAIVDGNFRKVLNYRVSKEIYKLLGKDTFYLLDSCIDRIQDSKYTDDNMIFGISSFDSNNRTISLRVELDDDIHTSASTRLFNTLEQSELNDEMILKNVIADMIARANHTKYLKILKYP